MTDSVGGSLLECLVRTPIRTRDHMTQCAPTTNALPTNLAELTASGWRSRSVKTELRDNLVAAIERGEELFPGILGFADTVIPEVVNALLSGHDMLFLGEKGQAKSRLMRLMTRFLDEWTPYLDLPGCREDLHRHLAMSGPQMGASRHHRVQD